MLPPGEELLDRLSHISVAHAAAYVKLYEIDEWELLTLDEATLLDDTDDHHLDCYCSMHAYPFRNWTSFLCQAFQRVGSIVVKVTCHPAKTRLIVNFVAKKSTAECLIASFAVPLAKAHKSKEFCSMYLAYHRLPLLFALGLLASRPDMISPAEAAAEATPFLRWEKLRSRLPPAAVSADAFRLLLGRSLPTDAAAERIKVLKVEAAGGTPLRQSHESLRNFGCFKSYFDLLSKLIQTNYSESLRFSTIREEGCCANTFHIPAADFSAEIRLSLCSKVENREACALTFIEHFLPRVFTHLADKLLQDKGERPSGGEASEGEPTSNPETLGTDTVTLPPARPSTAVEEDFWRALHEERGVRVHVLDNSGWSHAAAKVAEITSLKFANPANLFLLSEAFSGLCVKLDFLNEDMVDFFWFSPVIAGTTGRYRVESPTITDALEAVEAKFIEENFPALFSSFVADFVSLRDAPPQILQKTSYFLPHFCVMYDRVPSPVSAYGEALKDVVSGSGYTLEIDVCKREEAEKSFDVRIFIDQQPYYEFRIKTLSPSRAVEEACRSILAENTANHGHSAPL